MKYAKPFTALAAAILLNAAMYAPVASAVGDESVQSAGSVSYISGGVGTASVDRINAVARNFNVKLVFAMKSGDYVSDVNVTIADAAGKTLVNAVSDGPWFLTRLPAGNYRIIATFSGSAEKRTVSVGRTGLKTVDFRWGAE